MTTALYLLIILLLMEQTVCFREDSSGAQLPLASIRDGFVIGTRRADTFLPLCLDIKAIYCFLQCVLIINPTGMPCLVIKS